MRRSSLASAVLGVAFGSIGLASAQVTIFFDGPELSPGFGPDPWFSGSPKGTRVGEQYASLGARFSTENGVAYVSNRAHCAGTGSLDWGDFLAVNSTPPLGQPAVLHVTFWNPGNATEPGWVEGGSVSMKVSDRDSRPYDRVLVRTIGMDGVLIEERTLQRYEDTFLFTSGWVHEIQFFDNGADGFVVDDLSFGGITVAPEPATLAVIALGLFALVMRKRRTD